VLGSEEVAERRGEFLRSSVLVAQEELVDLACEAAREARESGSVCREVLLVDARPEVIEIGRASCRERVS
jgi:hypothetical protein